MLSVYIDFKCPASFLALGPLLELQQRTGVEITWYPFIMIERDVPSGSENDDVVQSHQQAREMSLRRTYIMYANLQGLALEFPEAPASTDLALGALASIEGDKLPFIKLAFKAYWEEKADLNDVSTVADLLEKCRANVNGAGKDTCRQALTTAQTAAESQGIVGTPAMVIAEQLFIGREHLPWIEEIIVGT